MGTFSTKVGSTVFAITGFTEERAKKADIDYVIGTCEAVDRYPAKLSVASKLYTKLIFSRCSHILLGAQLIGGGSVGEIINS